MDREIAMALSLEPEPCAGSGALEVASRVSKLLNNELHADVTFRVGDASFAAHRCLVACTSEPMRAMLGEGFREGAGGEVEIRGVEADVFFEFLRFVYTGEARVHHRIRMRAGDGFGVRAWDAATAAWAEAHERAFETDDEEDEEDEED